MESLEEVIIFIISLTVVMMISIYLIYYSVALSGSYQISSLKTQFVDGVDVYVTSSNIIVINSQSSFLINVKIQETYLNNSKANISYENYTNVKINTGNNVFPLPKTNPTYYSINFYDPTTNDYIYSFSGEVPLDYLHINNLFSGTSIYLNDELVKIPTSTKFNKIPLSKSINNITILSKYFYISKKIYLNPNQANYTITLPANISTKTLSIYGFNGTSSYPLQGVRVDINNITNLTTNSNGEINFPYSGGVALIKAYYPEIMNKNYTTFYGSYNLTSGKTITLYNFAKVNVSILLYYNTTYDEYIVVPGSVYFSSNLFNYSMSVSPSVSLLRNITKNTYSATVTTIINKTYGYFSSIPILNNYQNICFRLVLNGSVIDNYTCPPPPSLPPVQLVFDENGLPKSELWNVTLSNVIKTSTNQSISFKAKRYYGYNFSVGSPINENASSRFIASPQNGSVAIKNNNKTISINFTNQYYLTTLASPLDGGSVSPSSGWYNKSSSISISETPANYYHFVDWVGSGNGSYSGNLATATITMNSPIDEVANFAKNAYVVKFIESDLPTNTTWSVTFNGTQKSSSSNTITFNATQGNYSFSSAPIVENLTRYYPTPISGTIDVTQNTTQNIKFIKQFYLTMSANPSSEGTVSPNSGWYDALSNVEITEAPNQYYLFESWSGSGSGSYSGTNTIENITMDAPITEQANFVTQTFVLKFVENGLSSGQSWSVSLSNGNSNSSTTNTILFSEPHGTYTYTPSDVNINSGERYIPSPTSGSVTLTSNTTEDISYTQQYYLTMYSSNSTMGSVSPSSNWYNAGSSVSISATANSGYVFKSWSGSGSVDYSGTSSTATITMDSPITETGNFAKNIMYVPITISNSQSTATALPFQQMINLNNTNYSSYELSGLQNLEFTTGPAGTGTPIQAWIESNDSNSSTHTVIWVKLPNGIPADGSTTIYLNFMNKNIMSSSGPTGEAPQLSSDYAEYDNGASVFNNYWNFAGTSIPSGITSSSGTTYNNGASTGSSGGFRTENITIEPFIAEFYGSISNVGVSEQDFSLSNPNNGYVSQMSMYRTDGGSDMEYTWTGSYSNGGSFSPPSGDVIFGQTQGGGQSIAYINYEAVSSVGVTTGTPLDIGLGQGFFVQWLRTRTYPPNGVMPSVSFGPIQ